VLLDKLEKHFLMELIKTALLLFSMLALTTLLVLQFLAFMDIMEMVVLKYTFRLKLLKWLIGFEHFFL
jgi:hypothetical protein